MLYRTDDCSSIGDTYFLCENWMQDMIGELWLQTHIRVLSDKPFVCAYMHNLTITSYIWMFCMSNDCSTIGNIACVV